jgi:hypothetical protein
VRAFTDIGDILDGPLSELPSDERSGIANTNGDSSGRASGRAIRKRPLTSHLGSSGILHTEIPCLDSFGVNRADPLATSLQAVSGVTNFVEFFDCRSQPLLDSSEGAASDHRSDAAKSHAGDRQGIADSRVRAWGRRPLGSAYEPQRRD